MKSPVVDVYFDISSPWTYLAFSNLLTLREEWAFTINWQPILVGGIFNTINPSVYQWRENPVPIKAAYLAKDLADWAAAAGLQILWPPTIFPINSVKAMRACILADREGLLEPLALGCFAAYWRDDRDIADNTVLAEIITAAGLDADHILAGIQDPAVKDALRQNTETCMARGGFGSPTLFLPGEDMYFGNDRLPLVAARIRALKAVT